MTRSKAKRRPRTRVVVCAIDARRRPEADNRILHLVPEDYDPERGATQAELAADSVARLTGGEDGRFLGSLDPRALCGKRVRQLWNDAEAKLGCDRKCASCFALRKGR